MKKIEILEILEILVIISLLVLLFFRLPEEYKTINSKYNYGEITSDLKVDLDGNYYYNVTYLVLGVPTVGKYKVNNERFIKGEVVAFYFNKNDVTEIVDRKFPLFWLIPILIIRCIIITYKIVNRKIARLVHSYKNKNNLEK